MKRYFTGQESVISTHGLAFAEFVYDKYMLGDYFKHEAINYPAFEALALSTRRQYVLMLLHWMMEQASDCLEKVGHQWHLPPIARIGLYSADDDHLGRD